MEEGRYSHMTMVQGIKSSMVYNLMIRSHGDISTMIIKILDKDIFLLTRNKIGDI